jgi:hypothetical protein
MAVVVLVVVVAQRTELVLLGNKPYLAAANLVLTS